MWIMQYRDCLPDSPLITVNLDKAVDEADAWDWAIAWLVYLKRNSVAQTPELYVRWI